MAETNTADPMDQVTEDVIDALASIGFEPTDETTPGGLNQHAAISPLKGGGYAVADWDFQWVSVYFVNPNGAIYTRVKYDTNVDGGLTLLKLTLVTLLG